MSYEAPRKAKTLVPMLAKMVGSGGQCRLYKAGKTCKVQRNPSRPGLFIVWFSKTDIAQVRDLDLPSSIEYLDGRMKL